MKAGGRLTAKSIAEKRTCTLEIQSGIFSRLSIRVHVHVLTQKLLPEVDNLYEVSHSAGITLP